VRPPRVERAVREGEVENRGDPHVEAALVARARARRRQVDTRVGEPCLRERGPVPPGAGTDLEHGPATLGPQQLDVRPSPRDPVGRELPAGPLLHLVVVVGGEVPLPPHPRCVVHARSVPSGGDRSPNPSSPNGRPTPQAWRFCARPIPDVQGVADS
jgi:hypothetical protein